jgi:rod shape-determining protein MreD
MSAFAPALSVLLAVLSTSLPLGLPANATFVLPFLALTIVFIWRALRAPLPTYVAMLLGLLADITTGGPLGYWALMALLSANAGSAACPLAYRRNLFPIWFAWSACLALLTCFGWLLASLYFFRWIDYWPFAIGATASFAVFPGLFDSLRSLWRRRLVPRHAAGYGVPA